ncbi:hypothetical protein M2126_002299 [Polynucleobacter sphagniphilus]|uniref:Uncharacterized protein n=1 Tax=Polynucleobacter sphagniphilus TaxID=1743169 RepID=A0AA43MA03_9BURK|nr:hypothetical protein [Polynucleobacter sphagniphilus]MDH6513631.1 hypothetical protein [Polynucleobacter sphagniphilus]
MMKDMVRTFRTTQCPTIFSSTLISSLLFIPAFYIHTIHTNEEGVLIKLNFLGGYADTSIDLLGNAFTHPSFAFCPIGY